MVLKASAPFGRLECDTCTSFGAAGGLELHDISRSIE